MGCEIITTNDFKEILECKRKIKEFYRWRYIKYKCSKNSGESINIFKKYGITYVMM